MLIKIARNKIQFLPIRLAKINSFDIPWPGSTKTKNCDNPQCL